MGLTGKSATSSTTVGETNCARAVGSGSLEVFSTPMMIALMEQAACEALAGSLEAGQTTVGTQINVSHTAATKLGAAVTATAEIRNVNGRMVEFAVTAHDGAGEIGSGTHVRVIVDEEKFMARANARQ